MICRSSPAGGSAASGRAEVTRMFKDFMIQFNRTYRSPAEQQRRFGIFTQSLLAAQQLQETELGTGQYGVTLFSNLTGGTPNSSHPSALQMCTPSHSYSSAPVL
nr:cathepsin W-like [Pelodiscus sinensis]|eukprot:XP_025043851.1 cathepsin W-like [Pelodiscus sinensis]